MGKSILVFSLVVAFLFSIAYAIPGIGTYYIDYDTMACYNGSTLQGVMVAAASDTLWDNGRACGKKFNVKCTGPRNPSEPNPCTGKTVTVKIVDHCAAGCLSTINLFRVAFDEIANPPAGIINIDYTPA